MIFAETESVKLNSFSDWLLLANLNSCTVTPASRFQESRMGDSSVSSAALAWASVSTQEMAMGGCVSTAQCL